ncbi:tyrosine-type recombinase/integrase [Chryseobacterium sp. MP_3.2]|uniref:tyrosine-type recombinase/integrase n=1 Tax=Chryseobacterium sp. MP_3.2 TaxID=3071712 RepID=UPI002E153C3C
MTTRNRFSLRSYVDKSGESLIYLDVSDQSERIRRNTEIYIPKNCWDQRKQRIKNTPKAEQLNLVLENIEARITTIKTSYMLQERFLSAKALIEEFQSATPDFDFISFYRHHMNLQDYKKQTIKNHKSVLKKLEDFSKEIPFHKLTLEFLQKYRKFYKYNAEITYNSDLKCIKKYLNIAAKNGIKLNIRLDDLKVNVTSNKTTYLEPTEMKQLVKYYYNEFINPSHILPLGYFLFSCYTGLRISDIQKRAREEILGEKFQFSSIKTDHIQFMKLNSEARKMVEFREELFTKKLVDQKINFHLKAIAAVCKIEKNISMHVGRHTFATTFIRNNGDVYRLKLLLGHAKIEHTQKYVHLLNAEVLDDIDLIKY